MSEWNGIPVTVAKFSAYFDSNSALVRKWGYSFSDLLTLHISASTSKTLLFNKTQNNV